ncbi:MAG TPA: HEAT repeat domain-containing protein [Methanospirillum sp.]|nr:HEAT repeat domain-containing protein [Methanospirillum sp.]
MQERIFKYFRRNRGLLEAGKVTVIGLFALMSLFISIYFLYFSPYVGFRFVYVFIPHLYLIPIILLALWYPKSGLRLVMLIIFALAAFWVLANIFGYTFPPLFVILYTGIDLAVFVVFLLYVKDRRLVEAVIIDLIERNAEKVNHGQQLQDRFGGDFDAIIGALASRDVESREEAVTALSGLDDDRIVYPLVTALRDESAYVRRSAVEALSKSGSPKVIKPLIQALADDDRYVREAAAEALGHIGKLATPDLIRELTHRDWRVRTGSVVALRVSSDPIKETDPVIRTLSDESAYVRREAVKTLARIGDRRILPYLIEATHDPDSGVRLRAVRAVARVGDKEEVIPVLRRCLQDPDGAVRIRAGEELQKI